jgi:hypothetical protein
MGNDNNFERLFKLQTQVNRLVLEGSRQPETLLEVLQEILEQRNPVRLMDRVVQGRRIAGVGKVVRSVDHVVHFCAVTFSDGGFGVVVYNSDEDSILFPIGSSAQDLAEAHHMITWEFDEGDWIACVNDRVGYRLTNLTQYHDRALSSTWGFQCCGVQYSGRRAIVEMAKHGVHFSATKRKK